LPMKRESRSVRANFLEGNKWPILANLKEVKEIKREGRPHVKKERIQPEIRIEREKQIRGREGGKKRWGTTNTVFKKKIRGTHCYFTPQAAEGRQKTPA